MPKKSGPTTYTLASNEASSTTSTRSKKSKLHHHLNKKHHHQHHLHHHGLSDAAEDPVDPTDGNGSLTYSAASSVQSGSSAAGESTDSSFADIMRVLDLQDSSELKALIKKEGVSSERELREKRGLPVGTSGVSVASSLNYSTDGESALDGSGLLQTIAGISSDSYGFDGGGAYQEQPIKGDNENILFAPAAPVLNKKQRQKEKRARREAKAAASIPSKSRGGNRKTYPITSDSGFDIGKPSHTIRTPSQADRSPTRRVVSPDGTPPNGLANGKPGSPPPLPPNRVGDAAVVIDEDDDVWYAKWWMSCFPDSFKNLMPKR